ILVAVYFNFTVPAEENDMLRTEARILKSEMEFQRNFYSDMQNLKAMIDSLDIPGQNKSYQNSLINREIVDLQKKIPAKDSTYRYDMHMGIVQLYAELQSAKDKLHDLKDAENTIEEYKAELETTRTRLKERSRELDIALMQ
ncbi:MAG: type VI secretion system TssO, partial [Pricia sp.]